MWMGFLSGKEKYGLISHTDAKLAPAVFLADLCGSLPRDIKSLGSLLFLLSILSLFYMPAVCFSQFDSTGHVQMTCDFFQVNPGFSDRRLSHSLFKTELHIHLAINLFKYLLSTYHVLE